MVRGETKSGFKFEIDPEIIKDYEFLELAAKVRDDGMLFPALVEFTIGPEQKSDLVDHLKAKFGRATTEQMSNEYTDIITSVQNADADVKNS